MRSDAQVSLVVEQAIDDIGGFAGRRDRNRMVGRLASREVRIEKCGCGAFVMGVDRSDSFPRYVVSPNRDNGLRPVNRREFNWDSAPPFIAEYRPPISPAPGRSAI